MSCETIVYAPAHPRQFEWPLFSSGHAPRHTFGHRPRAAGVCLEDRQDLLGHKDVAYHIALLVAGLDPAA